MSKHILLDPAVINIVVETILGIKAKDKYSPWPTEWPNRTVSDSMYLPNSNDENLPPVLIEVQHSVDNDFILRIMDYCISAHRKLEKSHPIIINSNSTMRKHTSVPVKSTMIAIAKKSLVVLVDEYRTSVTCSSCHSTLENKHRRLKEGEEKYKSIIYCLKVCQTCLDGKRIWHRDVNAAINIKGIMMDYINSQYDIKSRHPSLYRGTPPAVIVPTAASPIGYLFSLLKKSHSFG